MLRRKDGAAEDQSAKDGEGEVGSQSVVRLVYRAGYATCRIPLVFAREAWR